MLRERGRHIDRHPHEVGKFAVGEAVTDGAGEGERHGAL
jgi:hypothetical protein